MTAIATKAALLERIQAGYKQFETLLTPLSEEQMTTPGVNSAWTVKDNIAHLTTWQDYLLDQLEGVIADKEPPEFMPGFSTEDEINEHVYQENNDRPLAEVMTAFHVSYQRVLTAIQAISEETLNAPFPWRKEGNPAWSLISGNTYKHYQEHGDIIRIWLGRSH